MASVHATSNGFLHRDFLVALLGYFSLFMSVTLFFIFPLFLKQFNPLQSRVGLIMGVHSLMAIIVRPLFGKKIDEKGGKRISLFGIGLLVCTMPFFHAVSDAGLLPFFLRMLTGIGWGISMTAAITVCSDLAPVDRLAHSIGVVGVAGLIASALGPILGEIIVESHGFGGLFSLCLAFLILSFICMLATKETIRENRDTDVRPGSPLKKLALPALLLISALPVVHGAVRGSVVYFIALFGKSIPLEKIGPFFLAFSAAAILTRLGIGDLSDRYGRKQVILPSAVIISLNLFLLSQVKSFGLFVLTGFVAGFGQGLIFPALSTYIIDTFGREHKGLALGFYLSLFDAGMALGSPFFGWVSDLYSYRTMYCLAGLLLFGVALLFTLKAPTPLK